MIKCHFVPYIIEIGHSINKKTPIKVLIEKNTNKLKSAYFIRLKHAVYISFWSWIIRYNKFLSYLLIFQ